MTACTSITPLNSGKCHFQWRRLFYWFIKPYSPGVYKTLKIKTKKNKKQMNSQNMGVKLNTMLPHFEDARFSPDSSNIVLY